VTVRRAQDRARLFFSDDRRIGFFLLLATFLAVLVFVLGFRWLHDLNEQQRRAALREKASIARQAIQPIVDRFRGTERADLGHTRRAAFLALHRLTCGEACGHDHVFMHDLEGTALFSPWASGNVGRQTRLFEDEQGNSHLEDVVRRLRAEPGGVFVSYWLPDPRTGSREKMLSFVQFLPELGVLVGTGVGVGGALRAEQRILALGLPAGLLLLGLFSIPPVLALRSHRKRSLWMKQEIRERLEVEEALRRSEATLKALVDSAPIGIASIKDRRFLDVNETFARIFQRDRKELSGQSTRLCYANDEAFETGGRCLYVAPSTLDTLGRRADGSEFPLLLCAAPLGLEGTTDEFVITALDMTERRKAEEEVLQNQEKFQTIFDASPMAIALNDPETGVYLDVNARCCEAFGLPKAEIVGRTPQQTGLHLEEQGQQEVLGSLAREETVNAKDMKLTLPGGEEREVLVTAQRIQLAGKPTFLSMTIDVTAWRRLERATQESERQLRTLFEGSPIGIFRSTPDGLFRQVNPALAAMFRYGSPKAMVEETNRKGIPEALYESPDQRAALMRRIQARMGTWFVEEVHFRRLDGTFLDGIMSIILSLDPETGSPTLFGFVQDISARKRAEDDLKAKTALLEAQTDATLDGILVVSTDRKRILTNQRFITTFNIPPDVLEDEADAPCLAHVRSLALHPEEFLEKVQYLYAHPAEASRDEVEFRGGMILERYSAPVLGRNGEIYGRIWIFHDISERMRAQQEILRLKDYLANVIDCMPSAVVGLDRAGRITGWNRDAENILGVEAREAMGRPIQEVAKHFTPWIMAMQREVRRERRPASMEKLHLEHEGVRSCYELTVYPLTTEGMEGSVVRIQDVTERVRIQELMIQTEKMVSVAGLAAGMAHEINNPLGIISQARQNIERRLSAELPANREAARELGLDLERLHAYFERRGIDRFLGNIREAVDRAAGIVSNALLFSHQIESTHQPVPPVDLLEKALELAANDYDLKKKYGFRDIEIRREFESGLPAVRVVSLEIEQVLLNLLKNAAQAMAGNPPERKPRIVLRAFRDAKHLVMEVEDNGPGMIESIRRRVFEPFFTTKEPGTGTGLGLSVSYTLVTRNHKGLMEVVSEPGRGSCFTIRLPMRKEPEDVREP